MSRPDRAGLHRRDLPSLVYGLLFAAVGTWYLASATLRRWAREAGLDQLTFDPRWVVPVVLVLLGLAGLSSALRRRPAATGE